jgi:metal-responsive CopG/Arc/MetJ family transcriptional regulator
MVKALDQTTKRRGLSSRSRALEVALTHWLRETRWREIEREVEAYYRSLTAMEKREDREWAQFASRSNRRLWD